MKNNQKKLNTRKLKNKNAQKLKNKNAQKLKNNRNKNLKKNKNVQKLKNKKNIIKNRRKLKNKNKKKNSKIEFVNQKYEYPKIEDLDKIYLIVKKINSVNKKKTVKRGNFHKKRKMRLRKNINTTLKDESLLGSSIELLERRKFFEEKLESSNSIKLSECIEKEDNDMDFLKKLISENHKDKKIIFDKNYNIYLSEYSNKYNISRHEIISNPKENYRYFGYRYVNILKRKELPVIRQNEKNEAVLIEFRILGNLEFIIRNTIIKLGEGWSHTIICGVNNYDFLVKLCDTISKDIKIIKLDYDNLNQTTYSLLLASIKFWENFVGEKILIYQEDSCIFKKNINNFINWDYIGAPWPKNQNDNSFKVGNGGFSLRTKQTMIDVINKKSIVDTKYNSNTINYMMKTNMKVGPEDVYFTLNMIRYNIGKLADWNSAFNFSTETQKNMNSYGGHAFWHSDTNWKWRLIKDVLLD